MHSSAIVQETDPYRQMKDLATFTDKLQPQAIPDAVREVELSQGPGKVLVLSLLASKWADSDTNAAISEARKPGDRITTETIISSVYSSLARHDLANAITEVGTPAQPAQLVEATQVIGNGSGGAYLWEMRRTRSEAKTFNGPRLINYLLPGEPTISPWNVISVASINDGGCIVGTATYRSTSPTDPIAAGPHGVMLMPLAIVRESNGQRCFPRRRWLPDPSRRRCSHLAR